MAPVGIPTAVDLKTWRLEVAGNVRTRLSLTLDDLKQKFEPVSLVAVNQCSGNARSLFAPRVPGGQWRFGAMSNARWTGARLKDVVERAGLRAGTVEISFAGLDKPALAATPAPPVTGGIAGRSDRLRAPPRRRRRSATSTSATPPRTAAGRRRSSGPFPSWAAITAPYPSDREPRPTTTTCCRRSAARTMRSATWA